MIFCFENYYDLLEKVKHDRSVINTSSELNENDFYPIINTILTLNHLFEWYYKDESLEKEKRVECIKRFNTYDSIKNQNNNYNKFISINGKALEININQRLIRQLANNLKHFKMKILRKLKRNLNI